MICDAGCGSNALISRYLFNKGLNIFGIDISEKCIEFAKNKFPEIKFYIMNMFNLLLEDQSLDGIVSYYSIIHTPKNEINSIFKEFNRVLKKNGKLLAAVKKGDKEDFINNLLDIKVKILFCEFLESEMESYFKNNGFKILYKHTREPYNFEINIPRIYIIGEKI